MKMGIRESMEGCFGQEKQTFNRLVISGSQRRRLYRGLRLTFAVLIEVVGWSLTAALLVMGLGNEELFFAQVVFPVIRALYLIVILLVFVLVLVLVLHRRRRP